MKELDFKVVCECGDELEAEFSRDRKGNDILVVIPCETCLDGAYEDGKQEGYDEGYDACEADQED